MCLLLVTPTIASTPLDHTPRFTTKYISPALQKVELQEISRSQTSIGNMEVHVYTGASEVAVVYKVDEFSIELFVRLPDSYPLHAPSIREGRKVKVEQAQWRKWMLQLNIFVTNQVLGVSTAGYGVWGCVFTAGYGVVCVHS